MFRLGVVSDKIRPLKVVADDKETVFQVVKASKKLKQLDLTIYIKPDRTKSERAEFERI